MNQTWLIKWLDLKALQVSIDGNEGTHDAIRGKGNLNQVCQGLDTLYRHGIRTRFSFTANLDNYQLLPQVAKICREHHVTSLWSDRYIPVPGSGLRPIDAMHMQEYASLLRSLRQSPEYQNTRLMVQNHRALQFPDGDETPYSCMAGEGLIVVNENGDIYPCRRLPIVCGNFQKTNLNTVYHDSAVFQDLRQHKEAGKCVTCSHGKKCRGGLRCMAYACDGEYNHPDPCCYL